MSDRRPHQRTDLAPVEWRVSDAPVAYDAALSEMTDRIEYLSQGLAAEQVWLLEHPPLYTAGTSAQRQDLIDPDRFPVHKTGRGGQYTYHGPGQRVAYVMLDLNRRGRDIRAYVHKLESWIIDVLADFSIVGETRADRIGVWVRRPGLGSEREDKIAAIGVRVRRWMTFHGIALNVAPDLEHYGGIVPCGVRHHSVTSLVDLGVEASMADVDKRLRSRFEDHFGLTSP